MKAGNPAEITESKVSVFKVPTSGLELDGTLEWSSTTVILVELHALGEWGLGYTYGNESIATHIEGLLKERVIGQDVIHIPHIWSGLVGQVRNDGKVGLSAMAISAVDNALWDLKSKCLGISLSGLLGQVRTRIEVYGSGGFTNYTDQQMTEQLQGWLARGISKFKIKIGRDLDRDLARLQLVRQLIGPKAELFVDANGAYDFQTALKVAGILTRFNVSWFEQPIEPSDLYGMKELRQRLPAGMNLASGEYVYDVSELRYRVENRAQDFIQLDATRCKGITGFLKAASECEVNHTPISSHCAPSLHVALGCALPGFKHIEYFSDHSRIEALLFDGAPRVEAGFLSPHLAQVGNGLNLNLKNAQKYRV